MNEEKNLSEQSSSKSKKITKTRDIIFRIGSLVCAVLLWMYVSEVDSPTSEKSFTDVQVTVENRDVLRRDHELSLITSVDFKTDIVLAGKKSALNQIDHSEIKAYIDLAKISEAGEYDVEIKLVAPSGTSLVSCVPQYATVVVDKTITSEFPIEADITYSNLPSAYTLGDCIVTDTSSREIKTVSVSGPESEIDSIARICAKADFGNVSQSVETKTNLVMYDNLGQEITSSNLKLGTTSVKLKLPVYMQKILTLSVEQAYNTFTEKQISFKISPSTIAVTGDPKILTDLEKITLDPINEKTIGNSLTTTVNTIINLPDGIETTNGQSTANITATLFSVYKNTIQFPTSSISLKNGSEKFNCEFKNEYVTLNAVNSTDSAIGEKDLTVSLDLSNYTEAGTYTENVNATVIDRINHAYVVMKDYPVTFTLRKK